MVDRIQSYVYCKYKKVKSIDKQNYLKAGTCSQYSYWKSSTMEVGNDLHYEITWNPIYHMVVNISIKGATAEQAILLVLE